MPIYESRLIKDVWSDDEKFIDYCRVDDVVIKSKRKDQIYVDLKFQYPFNDYATLRTYSYDIDKNGRVSNFVFHKQVLIT